MNIPYTLTNDSVTVVIDGKVTTVAAGAINYNAIRDAILTDDLELIPHLLTPKAALGQYLEGTDFYFGPSFEVMYKGPNGQGEKLPEQFERRIRATAEKGESPKGLLNFFSRLQNNPSSRSVLQLWPFLDHEGIPIEESGHFLAYKAVREDLLDCHSGTIANTPGNVIKIPRNKISDDPNHACHFGLHVGAVGYAHSFGERILIVRVDPANVVCIPFDSSFQKMRVCEYEVVGFHTADGAEGNANPMPSTTYEVDVVDDIDDDGEDLDESEGDEDDGSTASELDKIDFSSLADVDRSSDGKGYTISEPKTFTVSSDKLFKGWGQMSARTLLEQSIADLRTYASKKLKIVGASKVAGGKTALVKRILKVRK
jgi:hypothetical protein